MVVLAGDLAPAGPCSRHPQHATRKGWSLEATTKNEGAVSSTEECTQLAAHVIAPGKTARQAQQRTGECSGRGVRFFALALKKDILHYATTPQSQAWFAAGSPAARGRAAPGAACLDQAANLPAPAAILAGVLAPASRLAVTGPALPRPRKIGRRPAARRPRPARCQTPRAGSSLRAQRVGWGGASAMCASHYVSKQVSVRPGQRPGAWVEEARWVHHTIQCMTPRPEARSARGCVRLLSTRHRARRSPLLLSHQAARAARSYSTAGGCVCMHAFMHAGRWPPHPLRPGRTGTRKRKCFKRAPAPHPPRQSPTCVADQQQRAGLCAKADEAGPGVGQLVLRKGALAGKVGAAHGEVRLHGGAGGWRDAPACPELARSPPKLGTLPSSSPPFE